VKLMPRSTREVTNPTLDEAEQLIAASREPAGQLVDHIRQAPTRTPISSEPMGARLVDSLPATAGQAPGSSFAGSKSRGNAALLITNGWLICRGRLLTGPPAEVAWWRGNTRPAEAASAGLCLTRFVPGRIGPGFTDDLNALIGSLIAGGFSGVDHHYGLWYERRRDDHERIRRMNGEVWPPFYEQPFSRSGAGMAWDGLSRYDLTKYNPWYWDRLKEFAGLCDQAGLVLFHQNYFQHNILEAGAHWADCPWRSANNINETGSRSRHPTPETSGSLWPNSFKMSLTRGEGRSIGLISVNAWTISLKIQMSSNSPARNLPDRCLSLSSGWIRFGSGRRSEGGKRGSG
jgi:hypothetical protein